MTSKTYLRHNATYFLSDRKHYFYLRYNKDKQADDLVLLCIRKGKVEIRICEEPLRQRNRFQLISEFEARVGIQSNIISSESSN